MDFPSKENDTNDDGKKTCRSRLAWEQRWAKLHEDQAGAVAVVVGGSLREGKSMYFCSRAHRWLVNNPRKGRHYKPVISRGIDRGKLHVHQAGPPWSTR